MKPLTVVVLKVIDNIYIDTKIDSLSYVAMLFLAL